MNANFGIVTPIEGRFKGKTGKKDKNNAIADRALEHLKLFEDSIKSITG
jgi:NAD(FAD)-utilizing enzyme possibly involved in translation